MVGNTTDIEKKSLEAHVELCAERYKSLHDKLDSLDSRVSTIEAKIDLKMDQIETTMESKFGEIKDAINKLQEKRNNQLITWGVSIIGGLITVVLTMVWKFIM
jgi:predicted  nucleic acid-binding Zn-ribbon protein